MFNTLQTVMREMAMRKDMPAQSRVDIEALGYVSDLNPMSDRWKENIRDRWWSTEYTDDTAGYEKMLKLRDRLLAIDGESACLPDIEEDYDNIMTYGQLWIGQKRIRMMRGTPCQCHRNVCELYWANRNYKDGILRIATGYALSKDSMWRQHSWLVLRKVRSYKIIETTEKRELYFGFCMDDETAKKFCYLNG